MLVSFQRVPIPSGAVIGNSSVPPAVALWAVSDVDGDMGPLLTLPLGPEVTRVSKRWESQGIQIPGEDRWLNPETYLKKVFEGSKHLLTHQVFGGFWMSRVSTKCIGQRLRIETYQTKTQLIHFSKTNMAPENETVEKEIPI